MINAGIIKSQGDNLALTRDFLRADGNEFWGYVFRVSDMNFTPCVHNSLSLLNLYSEKQQRLRETAVFIICSHLTSAI
jgi:hypothetical protein